MNAQTEKMIAEMVAFAKTGKDVYPFMFQPMLGRSNTVSAAIRLAVKRGLLVQAGKDGTGKPKYAAPAIVATHAGTGAVN